MAQLGAPNERRAALDRICTALPGRLRTSFMATGRLTAPAPRTH